MSDLGAEVERSWLACTAGGQGEAGGEGEAGDGRHPGWGWNSLVEVNQAIK